MIQDIGPHQFHCEFVTRVPTTRDYLFLYHNEQILMDHTGGALDFPHIGDLVMSGQAVYLFSMDEVAFFTHLDPFEEPPEGYEWMPLSAFRTYEPGWLAFAGITGSHLYHWYDRHRFCGRCTAPMRPSETERALQCDRCGLIDYPRISPAIIVAITDGDRLLLSRYAGRTYGNYALIAGFCEIGETLEATIRREVMEEVGLRVKNLRYFASQPWAFSDSLLVGFFADLDGDPIITLDRNELSEAVWLTRDEIPKDGSTISLTRTMINAFIDGSYPR